MNNPTLTALEKIRQLKPAEDFLGPSRAVLRLVDVYSGSYGPSAKADPLREMGLGFSWIGPVVDAVLTERLLETIPVPLHSSSVWVRAFSLCAGQDVPDRRSGLCSAPRRANAPIRKPRRRPQCPSSSSLGTTNRDQNHDRLSGAREDTLR